MLIALYVHTVPKKYNRSIKLQALCVVFLTLFYSTHLHLSVDFNGIISLFHPLPIDSKYCFNTQRNNEKMGVRKYVTILLEFIGEIVKIQTVWLVLDGWRKWLAIINPFQWINVLNMQSTFDTLISKLVKTNFKLMKIFSFSLMKFILKIFWNVARDVFVNIEHLVHKIVIRGEKKCC